MRLLFVAFLSLSLLDSGSAQAAVPKPANTPSKAALTGLSRNTILPKWADALEQAPEASSDEPVVYRLAEVQYLTGPNPAYMVNWAIQVNSSARLAEIGQFSIEFAPAYQKVILHRIAILRGKQVLDRTSSADVRVVALESSAEAGTYLGMSSAKVLLEDVMPGDTLWLTYTVEGRNPVLGTNWADILAWSKLEPIALRKAIVHYPSGRPLQWRVSGPRRLGLAQPVIEQRGGMTHMIFTERALAAEELDPSLPPNLIPQSVLDFTEFGSWAQVTQWAVPLFPDASTDPDVRALVRKFNGVTPEERASQALHWVQDEIRYFSVSIGQNSHRPQAPNVVLKRRFGDCKDKSQLLVSLYRAMGLQAHPVLVNAQMPTLPAQLLPAPTSFDHVVVRVQLDGKTYYVDPTRHSEHGPISLLPGAVPGAAGLVVDHGVTELVSLPEEKLDAPLVERTERMTIPALHGNAQLLVRTEYRGRYAAPMRDAYRAMGTADIRKSLLAEVERTYPGINLATAPVLSDGADATSFVVEAQMTIPKPLREEEGHFTLPLRSHVMEGTLGIPDKLVRKYPLWLAAGRYRARYSLVVSLPGEARLVQKDDRLSLDTRFLTANAQLTWRGAHMEYLLDYAINNPEVAAADLPGLAPQIDKLNPMFENRVQFEALTVPPRTAKDASLRALDIISRLNAYADLQSETIRTGKLPELKFDDATLAKLNYRSLCDSAVDAVVLREWNPLLAAPAGALMKLADSKGDKRSKQLCAARTLLLDYDLRRASDALATVAADDKDPLTLMQAWADFHAGQNTRASSNLARYLKARKADGDLSAHDAISAFALARRLGSPEPNEVKDLVQALRPEAWPMPLFRYLRKEIAKDELFTKLEQLAPAAREFATIEAHFVVSQITLANHEPRQADRHVNWLRQHALLGSDYDVLAHADRFDDASSDPDARKAQHLSARAPSSNEVVRAWKAAAERGVAEAQYNLGVLYLDGNGVVQDVSKAVSLLAAAANQGHAGAMNDLGNLYIDGKYVQRDDKRGIAYYQQAVDNGNAVGAYNLARHYWHGSHGVPLDSVRAFQLFHDAAELGYADAQFFLGRLYFEGRGTDKNDVLARFWATQAYFRNSDSGAGLLGLIIMTTETDKAARQTGLALLQGAAGAGHFNTYAATEYGRLLMDSTQVAADRAAAFRLVSMASSFGYAPATALLGRMYVEGIGVRADRDKGLQLLNESAVDGLPEADFNLGYLYRSATSGITDKTKAAECFRRAAAKDYPEAAEALAVMLHAGDGIAPNLSEAARYYDLAVKGGRIRAMNNLASMYENGQGVSKDVPRAMALYREAANLGNVMAMLNLAELYESDAGQGTPRIVPLAYFMLASRLDPAEAKDGLQRMKAGMAEDAIAKAQTFADKWKPGTAMPEEALD